MAKAAVSCQYQLPLNQLQFVPESVTVYTAAAPESAAMRVVSLGWMCRNAPHLIGVLGA